MKIIFHLFILLLISSSVSSEEKEEPLKIKLPPQKEKSEIVKIANFKPSPKALSSSKIKINKLRQTEPFKNIFFHIVIDIEKQKLYLCNPNKIVKTYDISSSKFGLGESANSYKTPRGTHKISEKIGEDGPLNGIYKDRKFTGRIATVLKEKIDSPKDYITSRILWLDGIENKNKNTKERYIYIHGTYEEGLIGTKASHGCIRMKNKEVIELFDFIPKNTLVEIVEPPNSSSVKSKIKKVENNVKNIENLNSLNKTSSK
ncbi:MAG: hypothetical protein COA79_24160 [Planctomycetota bacterium]|nr:MAG: hypothetical protein COA79_24160 [Planctomycetota bacterium]